MKASELLAISAYCTHSIVHILHLTIPYLEFIFLLFRVRPAALWFLLNLHRGSPTIGTPLSPTPLILKHSFRL